jgi:hypothetical protein
MHKAIPPIVVCLSLLGCQKPLGLIRQETPSLTVKLDIPAPSDSAGGLMVADLDQDGRPDYLVTVPGHLAVYDNGGSELWVERAGDLDGDGATEVVFLTRDGALHVVDGETGVNELTISPPVPEGAERWELAMVADFRGLGDRDILLQATNREGYRTGRYLAAYSYEALESGEEPLWTSDGFESCAHNGARLSDLNGDGRDEVLGGVIVSADGQLLAEPADFEGHMDSVFVNDVVPEIAGLEIVLLEEGSNHVQVLGLEGPIWRNHFREQEPQNAAVGRFSPGSEEVFVWCRSRYKRSQKPFVFNSQGQKVFDYRLSWKAPLGWTVDGVEVIHTIEWTGEATQLACAKERHKRGSIGLFEPLTGRFVKIFKEEADRLYVADVLGDWREEVIVLNGNELHVYENHEPNPRPDRERLWTDRNYRRLKQYHNYYSP